MAISKITSAGVDPNSIATNGTNGAIDVNASAPADSLAIDASGRVGIGTSSPGSFNSAANRLVVGDGTGNEGATIYSGEYGGVHFADGTTGNESYRGALYYQHSIDSMQFWTAATERMRIDSIGNLLFNSGYGSVATAYGCRAWVNFNGTGTFGINASGNVSSVTDNAVGKYTVNLATAMPDANYAATATVNFQVDVGLTTNTNSLGTSSFAVWVYRPYPYNAFEDSAPVSAAVFR